MKILFLCTGNSCRSQMAEGYARQLGKEVWEVRSAGLKPQGVNPIAVAIMKEDGVDISQQKSTLLSKELLQWPDLVITLCGDANESCPVLPKGTEKQHWPFEDPAKAQGSQEEVLTKFRTVRDGIKSEITSLLAKIKSEKSISVAATKKQDDGVSSAKKDEQSSFAFPLWGASRSKNSTVAQKDKSQLSKSKSLSTGDSPKSWGGTVIKYGVAATAAAGLFFIGYKLLTRGNPSIVTQGLLPKQRL